MIETLVDNDLETVTVILILAVSSAVLLRDVSALASHVSIGIPAFLLAELCFCHSKNCATVRLRQRSNSVEPMTK